MNVNSINSAQMLAMAVKADYLRRSVNVKFDYLASAVEN